jgi:predicted metal-dependent peptidase
MRSAWKKKNVIDNYVDVTGSWDNIDNVGVFEFENPDHIAYVTVVKGRQSVFHWKGFNDDDEVRSYILKHEFGHIYYNHLEARPQFIEQVRSYRTDLTTSQENYILNVAMDMEINSTILEYKDLEKISDFLKSKGLKEADFVHPTKAKYPEGRKTQEYIDRIMLEMEDQNPESYLSMSGGDGESDQQDGNGQGSEQDWEEGKGEKTAKGKFGDVNITVNEEKYKELQQQKEDYGTEKKGEQRGNSANVFGEIEIEEHLTGFQKLKSLIAPYMKRIHRSYRLDRKIDRNVYKNVLRGKTKIYIPSYKTMVTRIFEKGAIDFLVDVSGSTSTELNKKIVRDTFELIATPGKFMDIYMWNTELVEKVTAKDLLELDKRTFIAGGGTDLADGIFHIRRQSKEKRPLVIISDLEDSLDDWKRALDQCDYDKRDVLVIKHTSNRDIEIPKGFPEVVDLPKEYYRDAYNR